MSSMNFPNLSLPTPTANPMSNPMGRNYMADPNANLAFAKNSGAASSGGGGGAAPISLEQQIQTLTQECAEYSKANPGGAQDVNCQQRLNQLIQSRNAATPQDKSGSDDTSLGDTGGNKRTQTKAYAGDPDLDEMERLHQMLLVNNSPYQQQQIRARIGDILYKKQQADKRQEAADRHQAYLDRVGRARESFAQSEAARKQNLADRKAQSEAASRRVAAKNAEADSSNRGAYATALAEGRISPEEYARLMGDTLGEGSNTTVAPQKMPPTPALDLAKGAPRLSPTGVIYRENGLRGFKNNTQTPTSPFPRAEDEASTVPDHLKPLPPEEPGRQFAKAPDLHRVEPNTPMFGNINNEAYGKNFRTHPMEAYADTVADWAGQAGNLIGAAFGDKVAAMRQRAMSGEITWDQFREWERMVGGNAGLRRQSVPGGLNGLDS